MSRLGGAVAWLGTFALLLLAMALLAGCSLRWDRLPDPKPGVYRYDVRITWGVEVP